MKRINILVSALFFLLGVGWVSGILPPKNTPIVAHFLNKNSIDIEVEDGLDEDKIKVELSIWGTEQENVVIFEEGAKNSIPKAYGENDWFLSYEQSNYGVFRHFKTNNWHDHHYRFVFYKKNGEVLCDAQINGPDQMDKITIRLNKEIKTNLGAESRLRIKRK